MRHTSRTPVLLVAVLIASSGVLACSSGADSDAAPDSPAARGEQLASSNGCTSCHSTDGSDGVGPTFEGLAGSEVDLDDGSTVTADDEYLRTSITDPSAQIVEGFNGIMPERSLDPAEVDALVAYLNSIGASSG